PEGSEGPGGRRAEARQGSHREGRCRGREEEAGRRRRQGRTEVIRPWPKAGATRKGLQPLPLTERTKNAPFRAFQVPQRGHLRPTQELKVPRRGHPKASKRGVFECLLTPTAGDALVRAMCTASPSAMVGSGQPTESGRVSMPRDLVDSCASYPGDL